MARWRGFVYFVECPLNGLIKIGVTDDHPDKRLGELRRGSPVPLQPLGILRGNRVAEKAIHVRFHQSRSHGEWFRPTPDLLAFIAEHVQQWPTPNPMWQRENGDQYEEWFLREIRKWEEWARRDRQRERIFSMLRVEAGEILGLA